MLTTQRLSIPEFLQIEDEDLCVYELVRGALVRMPEPSPLHEEIVQFLNGEFRDEVRRLSLNYSLRQRNLLIIPEGIDKKTARRPDLAVIDTPIDWRISEIEQGIRSVPHLIVEVASSNWDHDLIDKRKLYESLGVPEYWVVDYSGSIPKKECDRGKGRKVVVFWLQDGAYRKQEFLNDEVVPCKTFSSLQLSVRQILRLD